MKKFSVLFIVAILVTTLIAQALPAKLVRLEVYNDTGDNVYIRLEGKVTGQFYYLTILPRSRATWLEPSIYTIMTDYYAMTTWACGGIESGRELRIIKNFRLRFTQCGTLKLRKVIEFPIEITLPGGKLTFWKAPNFGEPTMEKVVYFQAVSNKTWIKIPFLATSGNVWLLATSTGNLQKVFFTTQESNAFPFGLQEYCSPNNCFWRFNWQNAANWDETWLRYGPGGNRFRYRY